jgi:hypothetical protein
MPLKYNLQIDLFDVWVLTVNFINLAMTLPLMLALI